MTTTFLATRIRIDTPISLDDYYYQSNDWKLTTFSLGWYVSMSFNDGCPFR